VTNRELMADLIRRQIVAVISELRPRLRQVFVMAHVQGKSRAQIAAALGISERSFDRRMTRALKACRDRLASHGVDPTDQDRTQE
jgi:RNA polymerase sigma factor (sigma-70 family)